MDRNKIYIYVNLLEGTCRHRRGGRHVKCDCLEVGTPNERVQKMIRENKAKLNYGILDFSFL